MAHASVFFNQSAGAIKPMHATNNGPSFFIHHLENSGRCGNLEYFKEAGIPFARTHDSSYWYIYGSEHTVDVTSIFPNFDADENDPASYDFACTDHYLKCCELAGTKVFYRLGQRIEHEVKKYGTLPPKDFHKWARICEHIIRHYNEGWADGFHFGIEYWEIWNEPDLPTDQASGQNHCWGGTKEEFFEFYHIAATHLKNCFPHLKIGGPAIAGNMEWAEDFLKQLKAPLDFFSWHRYAHLIEKMTSRVCEVRALLDRYGFEKTESILNEWNYVLGWHGEELIYSTRAHKSIKGAAFTLAAMCACQYAPLDLLMYYDARPNNGWNGMFDEISGAPLKGYYPFPIFNTLYQLKNAVQVEGAENIYLAAAKGESEAAITLTHFNDDDTAEPKTIALDLSGFGGEKGVEMEVYLLDENHDLEKIQTLTYFGDRFIFENTIPNFSSYLLKLKKI